MKGENIMKKIIPFKKDIIFKTNIAEITSISLENTLNKDQDNEICGDFTVSGEYRIADESIHTESFSYDLPFDIHMDEKYDLEHAVIDIDDFYYEIVNNNVLNVNIDVLIDKIEEKEIEELTLEEVNIPREDILEEAPREEALKESSREDDLEEPLEKIVAEERKEDSKVEEVVRCIEPEEIETKVQSNTPISSLFDNIEDSSETYKSYKIYIVREGDDLEFIMEKYATTREILEQYNDLKEIKIGDKIIIPSENEFA